MQITERFKPAQSIATASRSAGSVNGTGVDTGGFGCAMLLVNVGTVDASTTLDVKIQEADDDTNYTDVTGANVTQRTPSNDDTIAVADVRLVGRKKYLRAVGTVAGSGSAVYGASLILGDATVMPTGVTADFQV